MTTQPNPDRTLDGQDQTSGQEPATAFGDPNAPAPVPVQPVKQLSMDELLSSARRPRRKAQICLRADLQSEYDELIAELSTLISPQGNLLDNTEGSLGGDSNEARAQEKSDRLRLVRREMSASMRFVEFEGMPDDEWPVWHKARYPTREGADLTGYNNELIAKVAIGPRLTVEQVQQMRGTLGTRQMVELANKAWEACTQGGIDVPLSPPSLRSLRGN